MQRRGWALAYFDGTSILLLDEAHRGLVRKEWLDGGFQVLEQARQDYIAGLGSWPPPANPARLIGAGSFFLSLQQYEKAYAVYHLLVQGAPNMGVAWHNLGVAAMKLERVDEAIRPLERAGRIMK